MSADNVVVLGLGGNLGGIDLLVARFQRVADAAREFGLVRRSSLYVTAPVTAHGPRAAATSASEQPPYLNAALAINLPFEDAHVFDIAGAQGVALDRLTSNTNRGAHASAPPTFGDAATESLAIAQRLARALQAWELAAGRSRAREQRWGPRTLDIDLLWWCGLAFSFASNGHDYQLPHPRLHLRRFALLPLIELLGGEARHPVTSRSLHDHAEELVTDAAQTLERLPRAW